MILKEWFLILIIFYKNVLREIESMGEELGILILEIFGVISYVGKVLFRNVGR